MNDLSDTVVAIFAFLLCLAALAMFAAVVVSGYVFLTSQAVLVYEKKTDLKIWNWKGFDCHYFTGTRVVLRRSFDETGCRRFISVGDP